MQAKSFVVIDILSSWLPMSWSPPQPSDRRENTPTHPKTLPVPQSGGGDGPTIIKEGSQNERTNSAASKPPHSSIISQKTTRNTHPQTYNTHLEHSGLLGHLVNGAVRVEAAYARADHDARAEGGEASKPVDHARAGEVEQSTAEQQVALGNEGRHPAPRPRPVDHDRVDKTGQDDGVHDVGVEVDPLGDCPRDHGRSGGRESPLEHPHGILESVVEDAVFILEGGALEGVERFCPDEAPLSNINIYHAKQGGNDVDVVVVVRVMSETRN